jgi:hypothetical protein
MAPREPGRVRYIVPVVGVGGDPDAVSELEYSVCRLLSCDPPLPRCDGPALPAEECYGLSYGPPSELVIDLPFALDGFARLRAPGYMDLFYDFGGPMVGAQNGDMTVFGQPVAMVAREPESDQNRGMLVIRALDCRGQPAADVQIRTALETGEQSVTTGDDGLVQLTDLIPSVQAFSATTPDGVAYASNIALIRPDSVAMAGIRVGIGKWGQ